ncbi:unnamed protein product [Rhodiola kirilowii]
MAEAGQPPDPGGANRTSGDKIPTGGPGHSGGRSYASIIKAALCNRFPTIPLVPRQYGTKDGKPSVTFSQTELQAGVDNLKHSLVAKFSTGRPPIEEVRRAFMASWGLGGKCSIGALDARHILIVLDSEQEARKVLAHPSRKLGHAFFRVFRWTKDFDTKKESPVTTAWLRLMNLPPGMFNQGYIESIVTSFSRFIAVDGKTASFNNPCYARVCVEIDATKTLPDSIWINTGGAGGFWQNITYENRLVFCNRCNLHGHSLGNCRKALKRRVEEHQIWEGRDDHGLPIVRVSDDGAAGAGDKVQVTSEAGRNESQPVDSVLAWTLVQRRKGRMANPDKSKAQTVSKKKKVDLEVASASLTGTTFQKKDGCIPDPAKSIHRDMPKKVENNIHMYGSDQRKDNPAVPAVTCLTFKDTSHVLVPRGPWPSSPTPHTVPNPPSPNTEQKAIAVQEPDYTQDEEVFDPASAMVLYNEQDTNVLHPSHQLSTQPSSEDHSEELHSRQIPEKFAQKISSYGSVQFYCEELGGMVAPIDIFTHFRTGSEEGDNLIFQTLDNLLKDDQDQQDDSGIPNEEANRGCDDLEVCHKSAKEFCDQGEIPILHNSRQRKKKKGSRSSARACPTKKEGFRSSARACPKKKDTNYVWMFCDEVVPDFYTLNILMNCYCSVGCTGYGFGILAMVLKRGYLPNVVTYSALIHWLCRAGEWEKAEFLFAQMKREGLAPNVVTYTAVIRGLCQAGKLEEAKEMYVDMKKNGVSPNVVTYSSLIHGLCQAGKLEEAKEMYVEMKKYGVSPNVVMYNIFNFNQLLTEIVRANKYRDAIVMYMRFRDEVVPDFYTLNILMNCYCSVGCTGYGFGILATVMKRGYLPDVVTYTPLLHCLCLAGEWEKAEFLFAQMKREGVAPNVVTYTAVIRGLCQAGKLEEAKEMYVDMKKNGVSPNVVTYSSLIHGLCQAGNLEEAKEIYVEMKKNGVSPNVVTCSTLIHGLFQAGESEDAKQIFSEMKNSGISPDLVTYNSVIDGLCKSGNLKEAETMFEKMIRNGISSDVVTYNSLINGLWQTGKLGKAKGVFCKMIVGGITPDLVTYSSIIHGFLIAGKWEEAKTILREMENNGISPDVITYSSIIIHLTKAGKQEVAQRILWEMKREGIHSTVDFERYGRQMDGLLP